VWQDSSEGDRCTDEGIELFISADGKLEMARGNALDLEILGGVLHKSVSGVNFRQIPGMTHSCEFENFSS
jgi:hypothetical protein